MALTEERRASLMAYCRLEGLDEAELLMLEDLYNGAVSYMTQAGIQEPEAGSPRRGQYDMAVNAMVLDAWDNRGSAVTGTVIADNPAFRRTINQLKLTEPVSELDTGSGG